MFDQFLRALLVFGLYVKYRIRSNDPGDRLRRQCAKYDVVYHGKSGNQFGPRPRREQRARRFSHRHHQYRAVARDPGQPPRMGGQQRIE